MLMPLAFLPVNRVPAGFEIINVGTSGQVEALFQYFQQEWLPATKIPLWNVHDVSLRTNNHLEGWHSRMNKRARKHHLGFYQFLQLILDEQGKTVTVVWQIDDGYTHVRGSVRHSSAYGVQQRRPDYFEEHEINSDEAEDVENAHQMEKIISKTKFATYLRKMKDYVLHKQPQMPHQLSSLQ
ncbi:hypothetical protein T09_10978 [Trichinella sp. T9]|nr:hypothetical protein T09_10978 [Trichinella sp. T9]